MKVLLVGQTTSQEAFSLLDKIHSQRPVDKVISSGRAGSPTFAVRWAIHHKIPRALVPNDDDKLLKEKPDLVVIFDADYRDSLLTEKARFQGIAIHGRFKRDLDSL